MIWRGQPYARCESQPWRRIWSVSFCACQEEKASKGGTYGNKIDNLSHARIRLPARSLLESLPPASLSHST